jgi:hypothetical protein
LSLLAASLTAFAGCGDDGGNPPAIDSAPDLPDSAPAGASVSATVNPETVAAGGTIDVNVTVMNFTLEEPTGQANADGHGHYHIYLDNAMGGDYEAVGFDGSETITLDPAIAAGAHSFRVALHQNDHTAVTPAVETVVPFTVQ